MIKQKINDLYIKLDQLLKLSGLVQTGGQAKSAILNEEVKVNHKICTCRGKKLYNGDIIEYKTCVIEVASNVK